LKLVSVAFCARGSFLPTRCLARLKSTPTPAFFFLPLPPPGLPMMPGVALTVGLLGGRLPLAVAPLPLRAGLRWAGQSACRRRLRLTVVCLADWRCYRGLRGSQRDVQVVQRRRVHAPSGEAGCA
jgi:hypothetical protein